MFWIFALLPAIVGLANFSAEAAILAAVIAGPGAILIEVGVPFGWLIWLAAWGVGIVQVTGRNRRREAAGQRR